MTKYAEPHFPDLFTADPPAVLRFMRELRMVLGSWSLVMQAMMDHGLSLADNIDCAIVSFTSNATPDTEDTVAHTLGKVPTYYVVASLNKGAVVYKSGTAFTATNGYLKTTVATTAVTLILF